MVLEQDEVFRSIGSEQSLGCRVRSNARPAVSTGEQLQQRDALAGTVGSFVGYGPEGRHSPEVVPIQGLVKPVDPIAQGVGLVPLSRLAQGGGQGLENRGPAARGVGRTKHLLRLAGVVDGQVGEALGVGEMPGGEMGLEEFQVSPIGRSQMDGLVRRART